MADEAGREALLRREYHGQTARIAWAELAPHFAAGKVINVANELDLVEVAVQLGLDNVARFQAWTGSGAVAPLSDDLAARLARDNALVWAVVAPPWVLIQDGGEMPADDPASE
ncbi:MAG: DUF2288 domain-containing protein [Chromatocurvus sp.]